MKTPNPFCLNKKSFKAFVLGADPTNFSDNGNPKQLEYVFGILSDEPRYFSGILKNLNLIGLHMEDIYVQNLIPVYLESETAKNKDWEVHATIWIPKLIEEFDQVNPGRKKPVLVTAERIMKFLVNEDFILPKAKDIYEESNTGLFVVKPKDNKLGRPLYAFYRHRAYDLFKNIYYRELLILEQKNFLA
ncbi:MAG: hypothetical protein CVT99_11030 [Bacteroidetes bacterium HGW-Bacteroidetes-16]|jgi:hypothetical protein|nr:MAG: hypothetical protein CVT99_11030 [Bacteroidetes bacterium HGW-Bacteroidetes-16]